MKKTLAILSLGALLLSGCTVEVLSPTGKISADAYVPAKAGEFVAFVETEGVWNACALSSWLSVEEKLRRGSGSLGVAYSSNESVPGDRRFNRVGYVLVKTYDGATADTLRVYQAGLAPFLEIPPYGIGSAEGDVYVPFNTNLTDSERKSVSFSADASWVEEVTWAACGDSLLLRCATSPLGSPAEIQASFRDEWGNVTLAKGTVTR